MTIRSSLLLIGLAFAAAFLAGCVVYETSSEPPVARPVPPPPVASRPARAFFSPGLPYQNGSQPRQNSSVRAPKTSHGTRP